MTVNPQRVAGAVGIIGIAFWLVVAVISFVSSPDPGREELDGIAMPDIDQFPLDNGPADMGSVPCGQATAEVRRMPGGVAVVVWRLDGKVLAVVIATDNDLSYYLDFDFDGRVDEIGRDRAGGGDAGDFYRKVRGCQKMGGFGG